MVYGNMPRVPNPPLPPNVHVKSEPVPFENQRPYMIMLGRFNEEICP